MTTNIKDYIDSEIRNNAIVLFIKGTRERPECGFSAQVIKILDRMGCIYKDINILSSDALRQGIKDYSNWPTVPQLYVKGSFIGGCDIVSEMFQEGELEALLTEKNIAFNSKA